MSVQIVRFRTATEHLPEVEEAVRGLFAAIEAAAPAGLDYTAVRVGDGAEFLLMLELAEGAVNPLPGIPEALAFRARVADWAGAPVPPQPVTVLARYGR